MAVVAGGAPAQSPSMDGVWRSQGYGNVFVIHGRIDRIPRLPAVCDHPTENTPAGNFEVFAHGPSTTSPSI